MNLLVALPQDQMAIKKALAASEASARWWSAWLSWAEFINGYSARIRRELRDENARNAAWRGGQIGRVRFK